VIPCRSGCSTIDQTVDATCQGAPVILPLATFGNGDVFLWFLEFFLFVIWFWLLVSVFGDLFRDREESGGKKALWTILLIALPFLGILLYLIFRGNGMSTRAEQQNALMQEQVDARIRAAAGTRSGPADQISQAKALLDANTIDEAEFQRLKAVALAT
jgi:hypothetical protein